MEKNVNVVLTFQDYFDIIKFDTLELKEKVAYVLFYVTEIAGLRKDMMPKIISHRINDQIRVYRQRIPVEMGEKIILTTEDEIAKVILDNPSYFAVSPVGDFRDRCGTDVSYILTNGEKEKLWLKFDVKIKNVLNRCKKQSTLEKVWVAFCVGAILLLGIYMYLSRESYKNTNIHNLSKNEYLKSVGFSKCTDEEKGAFFIYYITQLDQLRDDITPDVVCERIVSMNYKAPSVETMKLLLDNSDYVRKSEHRDDAYVMTAAGIEKVEETIIANQKKDVFTIMWILSNISVVQIIGFVGALLGIISISFSTGFKAALLIK